MAACAINREKQHTDSIDGDTNKASILSDSVAVENSSIADTLQKLQQNPLDSTSTTLHTDSLALNTDSLKTDSLNADSLEKKKGYISSPVDYQATDSIVVDLSVEKMRMYNESQVHYQKEQINAYYIEVDMKKNTVYSKYGLDTAGVEIGYPVFKSNQSEYGVKEMRYDIKSKKGLVMDILMKEGEGYVRGELAKKVDENTFYLKNGRYTTCDDHDHPHYYIQLKKAKMIKEDKVLMRWANLVIEGVKTPIILPFGFFPLKKRYSSGILMPAYGEEKVRGFYFRDFGYYWAVNDHFDLRFNGSIYTNGSWATSVNSTYKKRYRYNGRLNLSFSINKFGDKGLDDYSRSKDFAIRWTHSQDSKAHPYRTLSASVNISSSQNDYRNSYSVNNIANTTKQSSVSYSRRWPDSPFNLSVALQHSQNRRDTTISLTLPNVSFSMQTQYPFRPKNRAGQLKWYDMISTGYTARLTNSIRIHEDKLLNSSLKRDWRNGFQHEIPIGASYKIARDLTFSANINYKGVAYLNSIRKSYDPIQDKIINDTIDGLQYAHNFTSSTSVAFTPKLFGMYSFKKGSRIKAIRHVISPSISLNYTPDFGFNDDKYYRTFSRNASEEAIRYHVLSGGVYGIPSRGSKGGSVAFSLDNNIEMKVRNDKDTTSNEEFKKIKLLESFRISTSYNIFADSMNFSNISLSGRTSLFKRKVNLQMSGSIDPYAISGEGTRLNKYAGGLGRLTSARLTIGTSFNGGNNSKKDTGEDVNNENNIGKNLVGGDEVFNDHRDVETFGDINEYVDFKVPWSLRLDYSFTYTKPQYKVRTEQNVRISGDLSLTEKWKVSANTSYNFSQRKVSSTSFSIYRDLHCWKMSFSAIPFGQRQSFSFRIQVKSSLLKDLKLDKNESWYDNF